MKKSRMRKMLTSMVAVLCMMILMSATALAATKEIVKDGAFQNSGFINAGQLLDNTIQGPGNWTQLNLGDAAVEAPYLHIILKATGDTSTASIMISDKANFNLSSLGYSLNEEYQDVVLDVSSLDMLSWCNFMGLDGDSSVYTIKDVFLSDDAAPTIAAAAAEEPAEEVTQEATDMPKTGTSQVVTMIAIVGILGSAVVLVALKKVKRA